MNKVLIIEDSDVFINILIRLLQNLYQTEGLAEASEALDFCHTFQPDIILLDIMLPGDLDGFGFLRAIKKVESLAHIPVILISALAAEEMILEGLKLGANDYLVKPFGLQQLLLKINNLITLSEKTRQNALIEKHIPFQLEGTSSEATLLKLDSLIEESIVQLKDLSITAIAEKLHISQSSLTRLVKDTYDTTPNNYIMKRKLEKANILLHSKKGLSVKEVSAMLGFGSVSYFGKCYKKFYGCYPSDAQ